MRQLYLLAGEVDLLLEHEDDALRDAVEAQWQDLVARKLYITGGVGSEHNGESFGAAYELGNGSAYCETCAAIANLFWNWRLLLLTGDARYADLIERTLFNGVLCGVSLQGGRYFYVNPLRSDGGDAPVGRTRAERFRWHECACCPPNLMRLLASIQHYVATRGEDGLQIEQYAPARVTTDIGDAQVALAMGTDYPWRGTVEVRVEASGREPWTLALRIPAWCVDPTFVVDGAAVVPERVNGYARLRRVWRPGDVLGSSCRYRCA